MAAKYNVPLPQIIQPPSGFPVVNIPGEKIDVVTTPVDLATAEQDPEIILPRNSTGIVNPLDLSVQDVVSQVRAGNAALSPLPEAQNRGAFLDLWQFLRDTKIGNALLLGIGVAIVITLVILIHHWTSDTVSLMSQLQIARDKGGLAPKEAAEARKTLDQHIADTHDLLIATGSAPEEADTISTIAKLEEGSVVAASVRRYADAHAPFGVAPGNPVLVTGLPGPRHYASLKQLNLNHYLDTLSKNQQPGTITENSAVIHALETRSR